MTDTAPRTETRTITVEMPVYNPYYPFTPPALIAPDEMPALEAAAYAGDANACHKVGISYFHGINGKPQDTELAYVFFENGAHGNAQCAHNVGSARLRKGLDINNRPLIKEGIEYLKLSNSMNFSHACYSLFCFFEEASDEYKDLFPNNLTTEYHRLALKDDGGLPVARYHLAIHLLELADEEGDVNATYLMNLLQAGMEQPSPMTLSMKKADRIQAA